MFKNTQKKIKLTKVNAHKLQKKSSWTIYSVSYRPEIPSDNYMWHLLGWFMTMQAHIKNTFSENCQKIKRQHRLLHDPIKYDSLDNNVEQVARFIHFFFASVHLFY